MEHLFIFLLAAAGWIISIYFTGVTYRWFQPNAFWVPKVCRLDERSCIHVLQTPRARLGGVPNSVFGIFLYAYVMVDVFYFEPIFGFVFVLLALLRSIYLAYSLIFITKIPCVLCFTSHGINLLLLIFYFYQIKI